ncbi:MAG TPA: hypothetical protein VMT76_02555 [Puia sp.]|nr:hypothetical protein [Puia sp.]
MRVRILICLLLLCDNLMQAQVLIKGTVYDRTQTIAMRGVTVMDTSGTGTITDSSGHYAIRLPGKDSIFFSYLNKATLKFPVSEIPDPRQFDMSIDVAVDSLPSVSVMSRSYGLDSIENRREYQKIFNYGGAEYLNGIKPNKRGAGVGLDLDMDMFFNGKKERRLIAFQQRLEDEEKQKYIDHRFTKNVVKKVTGLEPPLLDSFMRDYRPTYEFLKTFNTDWEYYKYILDASKSFLDIWNQEHPGR